MAGLAEVLAIPPAVVLSLVGEGSTGALFGTFGTGKILLILTVSTFTAASKASHCEQTSFKVSCGTRRVLGLPGSRQIVKKQPRQPKQVEVRTHKHDPSFQPEIVFELFVVEHAIVRQREVRSRLI